MKEALILNKEIDADRSEFVSDPIGEFYTRHPYPPPVENLDRARDEWRDINRHRAEFHLFWPHKSYRADFSVLVAGCGTWQAAKFALCHPSATVIGIDISPTSLTETERLKKKYKLSNLETVRLRVEEAASLDKQFDLIVCTGVLHHLNNREEGLRALRDVLNPCGAMYLMVYAKYGRAGIYMLQEYCRRLGIGNSSKEIAELNEVVTALPAQHPLAMLFRGSRDAGSADALADALLNPRDRAYSVSEVLDSIDQAGMSFGRWYW